MNRFSPNRRIIFVGIFMTALFVCIGARLYYLQFAHSASFKELAQYQQISKVQIMPKRGEIFDRNGKALATNMVVDSVFADPRKVTDPYMVAFKLAEILGVDEKKTYSRLIRKKAFVWIKRKIDKDLSARVKELHLDGIYFREEVKRVYPKGRLLSHVLGFVGTDGHGLEGLEAKMNCELTGEQGWRIITKDAKRREVANFMPLEKNVRHGNSIELTIDEIIQYIAESELEQAYLKYHPDWGGIIVMRPSTGEILAMASQPTYDPNKFGESVAQNRRNRVITDMFEPGSIFKIISCSAALNEGAVRYDDQFDCENGAFRVYRHTLHDCHQYNVLSFPEIIAVSSNIGTAKIAMNLGAGKLYNYISRYGFGKKTGILLNGECKGILRPLRSWSKLSILAVPMGQEISVSALQMIKAVSAVANEGTLMKPYLIRRIIDSGGSVLKTFEPEKICDVLTPKTAKLMNEALKLVVRAGTGIYAQIPEYTVAGKTGTAQKVIDGRYSQTNYVGSFVGYVPADDPQLAIIVVMDNPKEQYYGGVVAAPVFREVARKVLKYLEVPPEPDRLPVSQVRTGKGELYI